MVQRGATCATKPSERATTTAAKTRRRIPASHRSVPLKQAARKNDGKSTSASSDSNVSGGSSRSCPLEVGESP